MSDGQFGTDFFNRFSIVGGVWHPPHTPHNVRPCEHDNLVEIDEVIKMMLKISYDI